MKIAIYAVDGKMPNLALMKLSAWHKAQGDEVEHYNALNHYDICYMAKIFNFSEDDHYIINADKVVKGGTGYDITSKLPPEVDAMPPDYSVYPEWPAGTALGFLTRGCPNRCKWCVVPIKEGGVMPYRDIDEVCENGARRKAILLDNNVLASEWGLAQLDKIADRGYRIDFNQAMDARLVTDEIAAKLARIKWLKYIRFGCDTPGQITACEKAIALIDGHGYKGSYFFYCMIYGELQECYTRISHWRTNHRYAVQAQPFRDPNKRNRPPQWQKDLARWANRKETFRACDFKEFSPRHGFICKEYFI